MVSQVEAPAEAAALARENDELKALLETTLNALEVSRAETAHAVHAARVHAARVATLEETVAVRDATASLQSDRLHSAAQQSTQTQRGEQVETEYSLISSSVELHAMRHKLLVAQRHLDDAKDDIAQLHIEYDVVTHQLLAEQSTRAAAEADARSLRQKLGDAAQGLMDSANTLGELKALVQSLQVSLTAARAESARQHAAFTASEARVRALEMSGDTRVRETEALVVQLRADLASSRESAEALRRDLRAAQADGEGRARERDESTRNLRNELRDADETIGALRQQLRTLGQVAAVQPSALPHIEAVVAVAPPPAVQTKKPVATRPVAMKTGAAPKVPSGRRAPAKTAAPSAPVSCDEEVPVTSAPVSTHVDIDAPFVPPTADDEQGGSDEDSDFDILLPARRKRPAPKTKAAAATRRPRSKAAAVVAEEGDAPPESVEPPTAVAPPPSAPASQAAPVADGARRLLGPIFGNVVHHMADAAPKKRKLLGAPAIGAVDTMPPSFLLSMMGTFAPPKLRTL